jgi:penicillin-binding protein 2
VEVAGKTGTAQFWRIVNGVKTKDNHTWFICFAPYDKPKYAVCVLLQGGKSGGGCSAPVAKRVLSQALALDQGYQVAIAPMPEVLGNFNPTEAVVYADDPVAAQLAASADDGDTGAQAGERESQDTQVQDRKVADESMIRKKAKRSSESQRAAPAQAPAEPEKPQRKTLFGRLFGR